MACASCAAKSQLETNKNIVVEKAIVVQNCLYTIEELQLKLLAARTLENWNQVSFIQSAINYYYKDCNVFNNHIL